MGAPPPARWLQVRLVILGLCAAGPRTRDRDVSADVIYLDSMATTRLAPEARAAMRQWLDEDFGNASSSTHAYGWKAADAVEAARERVARAIGARRSTEIVFTSGATESNNTVIKGVTA